MLSWWVQIAGGIAGFKAERPRILMVSSAAVERNAIIGDDSGSPWHCPLALPFGFALWLCLAGQQYLKTGLALHVVADAADLGMSLPLFVMPVTALSVSKCLLHVCATT